MAGTECLEPGETVGDLADFGDVSELHHALGRAPGRRVLVAVEVHHLAPREHEPARAP